ncbi:hypothetical protein E2C01_031066 [Portunus trituberculatus]|uniref:Uncharacterized protein n=1 Tax=Portunus trituberculatus TaxID=210409 RepID=A0A5B7EX42_PORTR|nr:hypothetical protein [Portunus trituberculatus]
MTFQKSSNLPLLSSRSMVEKRAAAPLLALIGHLFRRFSRYLLGGFVHSAAGAFLSGITWKSANRLARRRAARFSLQRPVTGDVLRWFAGVRLVVNFSLILLIHLLGATRAVVL